MCGRFDSFRLKEYGPFGNNWKLKTENIVTVFFFKYINSTVRSIFNIFFIENECSIKACAIDPNGNG